MFLELLKVFLVGGIICVIGQLLLDKAHLTPAHTMCVVVASGSILGALGLYPKWVEFAGFGASLPIASFGNSLVQGAMRAAGETGFWGIFKGLLGGVSYGMVAAILFGFLAAWVFRPQSK